MTKDQFLRALEEALVIDAGTLTDGLALADVREWDSLGVVEFQSLVDEQLGKELPPQQITACETVDELVALVADKLDG
jgi:acyl carrier protein